MSDVTDHDTDTYLTVNDAAEYFGRTTRTIQRWASEGKVRTRPRRGRKGSVYSANDLRRVLESTYAPGQSEYTEPPTPATPAPATELLPDRTHQLELELARADAEIVNLKMKSMWLEGKYEEQSLRLKDRDEEIARLRREVEQLRRPWWLWWLRG